MTDHDWKAIQARLQALGFDPGPVDGIRGARTNAAVLAFRQSAGLDIYDDETSAALFAAADAPAPAGWDSRSAKSLTGVHPDLVRVMERAQETSPQRFTIIEGLRTIERQRQLVASGASQTLNSRHLTGHAVDVVPVDSAGRISWDWPLYHRMAPVIKQAAADLGVTIVWGGDWRTFKDGPHWELDRRVYP